jgi:iron(III) transport system substrate-binding protein
MTRAIALVPAPRRRGALLGVALLLLSIAVAGCGSSSDSSSKGASTITLYSAQHEQTTSALIAAFTKQTGIKVNVDNNDEDVLTAQIEQEGSRSPADVFYTENSNWLEQLNERSLLAKVDDATLANAPRRDSATNGDWLGVSARISVLVYNTGKLAPAQLPKSVMELADPKWKGKIELAPAETDFWPIVSSIARAKGRPAALAWLNAVKDNAGSSNSVPDNETLVRDVGQGTTELGLINHYYYYRLRAEVGKDSVKSQIAYFVAQDPGYVEDISGAAILKSSKHTASAQRFLDFLTSEAGQKILAASDSFEYPINEKVAANPQLTPLDQLHPSSFTPAELASGLDAKQLLQEAGLI